MAERKSFERLEDRLDERFAPDHPRRYAIEDEPTSDPATLRDEQFREADEMLGAPTLPFVTGPMWRGMVLGGIAGAVLGAALAAPLALIPMGQSLAVRLVVVLAVGATAGATAGAHYWGGRVPELSGESVDADNRPSVGSTLADPGTDRRGR